MGEWMVGWVEEWSLGEDKLKFEQEHMPTVGVQASACVLFWGKLLTWKHSFDVDNRGYIKKQEVYG